jgi:hypothetical protein
MNYDIKSKPTIYKGTKYRSRLEARWAAFFDLLGFTYQYEPYDLNGWTPDFVIYLGDKEILCEVKPTKKHGFDIDYVKTKFLPNAGQRAIMLCIDPIDREEIEYIPNKADIYFLYTVGEAYEWMPCVWHSAPEHKGNFVYFLIEIFVSDEYKEHFVPMIGDLNYLYNGSDKLSAWYLGNDFSNYKNGISYSGYEWPYNNETERNPIDYLDSIWVKAGELTRFQY